MYFTVETQTGRITGLHSHQSDAVIDGVEWRQAIETDVRMFMQGMTFVDLKTGALQYPPITDKDMLRTEMLIRGNKILNEFARERQYLDLQDLLSFKDSTDPVMAADATQGVAARDKMRSDILAYVESLSVVNIAITDAMANIDKPVWS